MIRLTIAALATLLLAGLGGCTLLPKPAATPEAFRPQLAVTARAPRFQVLALELAAPSSLYDSRTPALLKPDGRWRGLGGFQFAAPPAELAQQALADALERSGLAGAVLTGATASPRLTLELRAFEAVDGVDGRRVTVAWTLRLRDGARDAARRIDASAPVSGATNEPTALMAAWQTAMASAIEQSLDWLSHLALPPEAP